jgi:lysozyme
LNKRKTATPRRSRRKKKNDSFFRRHRWAVLIGGATLAVALYIFVFVRVFVDPFSFRWNAIYGEGVEPDGFEVRGIDISHYQERIDWSRVRNAQIKGQPLRFVIIKATEGISIIDENFIDNFYQARQNDLIRGAYHFFTPDEDPVRQARFFIKQVKLETGDLPPVLDVEKAGNLSTKQLRKAVHTWLDVIEKHYGIKPIIYTGYSFKLKYLNDGTFDAYPYWIAHYYVEQLQYKGQWSFWQYTDMGRIDGINGSVDCNIFNGELPQLVALTMKPEEIDEVGL